MQYTTDSSVTLNYTIPAKKAANDQLTRYHVEVLSGSTGVRTNFPAGTLTPAVAPTAQDPAGVPGLVSFPNITLADPGIYVLQICYATAVDLDGYGTAFVPVGSTTLQRVTATNVLTA